ncbi:hypothetical protein [uncultured Desulfobulbus sp.]|uniref:hypothetical protein n=1 Tax=uncultured Desulfobulbus sp. TaxID=239745 RepID=UPI0029C64BC0|nr:hypothetical protein [uncultured Desulfobulbus sp.]
MRDAWYSDNRDLVKWSVLSILAERYDAKRVLQIAYYNKSNFGEIVIGGEKHPLPTGVLRHFRNIGNVATLPTPPEVAIFDVPFEEMERDVYHEAVKFFIHAHNDGRSIVFLDPDTGLEPEGKADKKHVLNTEIRSIWDVLPHGWLLVIYQHQTNRAGKRWVEPKRKQFASALQVKLEEVKVAHGAKIAADVVFFFTAKAK